MALGRNIYENLVEAVKPVVAKYGISGVTTRNLAKAANVSDSNIYRFFPSRNDLLFEAYRRTSGEMTDRLIAEIDELKSRHGEIKLIDCARRVYMKAWRYLVDDPDMCLFHSFYFNSIEFCGKAVEFHDAQTKQLTEHMSWLFNSEEDATRCLYNIFSMLYSSARLAVLGVLPNTEETAEKCFRDAYHVLLCQSNFWPD